MNTTLMAMIRSSLRIRHSSSLIQVLQIDLKSPVKPLEPPKDPRLNTPLLKEIQNITDLNPGIVSSLNIRSSCDCSGGKFL